MKVLYIDACVREEKSRTKKLAEEFLKHCPYEIETVQLTKEKLPYFAGDYFWERERLLEKGEKDHPRFSYARQFAKADYILIAAPFWDLSFPAILKAYLENISVDGITFYADKEGCHGMCKAKKMIYITTRGGIYGDSLLEMGVRTMKAMAEFFGVEDFEPMVVEGLDIEGVDVGKLLEEGKRKARKMAQTL